MIVTTEYIYHNPLREEIGDIVKNTIAEHKDKYGHNPYYKHRERGNIQFFDNLENKLKNAWVKGRCLLYQAKRRETASKGRFEIHKIKIISLLLQKDLKIELQKRWVSNHQRKDFAILKQCRERQKLNDEVTSRFVSNEISSTNGIKRKLTFANGRTPKAMDQQPPKNRICQYEKCRKRQNHNDEVTCRFANSENGSTHANKRKLTIAKDRTPKAMGQ